MVSTNLVSWLVNSSYINKHDHLHDHLLVIKVQKQTYWIANGNLRMMGISFVSATLNIS